MSIRTADKPDAADDGHPCEAALEFRRQVIIKGFASEVPADVIDLCIAIAWIGKAISRSATAPYFLTNGIDPNSWQIIPAIAGDEDHARKAMTEAGIGLPMSGRRHELAKIRNSESFRAARDAVQVAFMSDKKTARAKALAEIAAMFVTEPERAPLPDGVVDLAAFRKSSVTRR